MLVWKAYSRMIDALAFAPDGRTLALAGCYLACRLIDATTGQRLWTARSSSAFGLSLAFAPGRTMLSQSWSVVCRSGGVSIRDTADGVARFNSDRWCQAFALAPDGRAAFVADGGYQDLLRRYDLTTGAPIGEVELEAGAINRVSVSPNGKLVALVGCKRFYLLTTDRLEEVASIPERAFSNGAFALAFAPDGNSFIYTAGRTLFAWNADPARGTNRVSLESKYFMDAAFTPDSRKLITVSKEGVARVWETANWECERSFAWNVGPLRAVAVSPDGTRAAVAGDAGRVVVWDLE